MEWAPATDGKGYPHEVTRTSTKARERRVLRCVYDESQFEVIMAGECPDFRLRRHGDRPFGVEVTEVFPSQPEARAACIPGYVGELLDGAKPRHKEDATALEVVQVQILDPNGNVKAENVPAIFRPHTTVDEYRRLLVGAISSKGLKRAAYDRSLEHVNLIVRDHVELLRTGKREDFSRLVLDESLKVAALGSRYREVFLVTRIDSANVYVPLVMLSLVAEAYMFDETLARCDSNDACGLADASSVMGLLAQFLCARGFAPLVRRGDDEVEVLLGNVGLVLDEERGLVVRDYSDFQLPEAVPPPRPGDADWRLPDAVLAVHTQMQDKVEFVSAFVFDVLQSDQDHGPALTQSV